MERMREVWAAVLGVPGFPADGEVRVVADLGVLTVVRLGGGTVVAGPADLLAVVADVPATELLDHDQLLRLTAPHGALPLGQAHLFVLTGPLAVPPDGEPDHGTLVAELESVCSEDDVDEVGLGTMTHRWVLLDAGRPVAGAGYDVWRGRVAHLGVLTAPGHRGRRLGRRVAALATRHAVDAGLVPQWRSRTDNDASAGVARALGFVHVGGQTSVRCPPGQAPPVDWDAGATARVAALARDRKGRLLPQLLADDAVRCALVLDLAVAGRITHTDDHVELDTTPTGFAPADALLAASQVELERALTGWFAERRIGLEDVATALVERGAWTVRDPVLGRPRYQPADRARSGRDLRTTSVGPDPTPADAAVVALGRTAHLVGEHRRLDYVVAPPDVEDAVAAAGPHAWLLAEAVAFLLDRRTRYRWGDTVLD